MTRSNIYLIATIRETLEQNPKGLPPKGVLEWNSDERSAPLDYGKSLSPEELEKLCGNRRITHPVRQPGDTLLFDEMTVHQTVPKRWVEGKQVVTIGWFFCASGFPDWSSPLAI